MRYALYFVPQSSTPLARIGAAWLGCDLEAGRAVDLPPVPGFDPGILATLTAEPRRYGLHATLKPPFALADGHDEAALLDAVAALAAGQDAFHLPSLRLAAIGRFLALVPDEKCAAIHALADACVEALDAFRRPADARELERRRASGLTARQDAHLLRWGYPYVFDEYRFHITLTGKLDDAARARVTPVLEERFEPALNRPVPVCDLCVAVEPASGAEFRLLRRIPLRKRG